MRFIPLYSSNDCCQIVSYQVVPATFSQIRLPEDLLLLQQVLENLVEHFFMLNTPTRVISKRNFRERSVPSVKFIYDIVYPQLKLPNRTIKRESSRVNSSYWYPLQDACAAFLPNLEIALARLTDIGNM